MPANDSSYMLTHSVPTSRVITRSLAILTRRNLSASKFHLDHQCSMSVQEVEQATDARKEELADALQEVRQKINLAVG